MSDSAVACRVLQNQSSAVSGHDAQSRASEPLGQLGLASSIALGTRLAKRNETKRNATKQSPTSDSGQVHKKDRNTRNKENIIWCRQISRLCSPLQRSTHRKVGSSSEPDRKGGEHSLPRLWAPLPSPPLASPRLALPRSRSRWRMSCLVLLRVMAGLRIPAGLPGVRRGDHGPYGHDHDHHAGGGHHHTQPYTLGWGGAGAGDALARGDTVDCIHSYITFSSFDFSYKRALLYYYGARSVFAVLERAETKRFLVSDVDGNAGTRFSSSAADREQISLACL